MKIKVKMNPVSKILKDHGVTPDGDVQKFLTLTINRRIGRYMPHVTGALETKQKYIASPTSIEVVGPQVKYLYFGNRMVNAKTGKGPGYIPNVGYRYRKGTKLVPSSKPLTYTKTFNPNAGPYWDRRLMAAEKDDIAKEVTDYANRPR